MLRHARHDPEHRVLRPLRSLSLQQLYRRQEGDPITLTAGAAPNPARLETIADHEWRRRGNPTTPIIRRQANLDLVKIDIGS